MSQDFSLYGVDMFGTPVNTLSKGNLSNKFTLPPFSVLDARQGEWQERKSIWLNVGIQGELGRDKNTKTYNIHEWMKSRESARGSIGTEGIKGNGESIFDPVLCELAYSWFCPPGGQVVDPFAGGSVRGIVASLMGFHYWGCDLSAEQITANEAQAAQICTDNRPQWINGDSIDKLDYAPEADFIFSCPPYGDLERYSEDPRDLSTMDYHTFLAAYKRIILRCARLLKPDRFACFVVGDFRNPKTGNYRGFVADTIMAFREQGLNLYNDAILVTAVGSLPIRVSGQFDKSRKLGKTHQNVLVFQKGDARKAFDQ
jgi:DNA modification methylase